MSEARAAVVVPIRGFRSGKGRLAVALSDTDRASLARRWARRVLDAAAPLPVYVVTSDDEVIAFASERGAKVIADPGSLNAAAAAGRAAVAADGYARVVVAHADIAHPTPFAWVANFEGVTIIPDRHGHGTNVMGLPTDVPFTFQYGERSFTLHMEEASARGLAVRVRHDAALGWDVDEPDDLHDLEP